MSKNHTYSNCSQTEESEASRISLRERVWVTYSLARLINIIDDQNWSTSNIISRSHQWAYIAERTHSSTHHWYMHRKSTRILLTDSAKAGQFQHLVWNVPTTRVDRGTNLISTLQNNASNEGLKVYHGRGILYLTFYTRSYSLCVTIRRQRRNACIPNPLVIHTQYECAEERV